ncbi:unnamed protein product, partial [Meganyctiphanes norvegica]
VAAPTGASVVSLRRHLPPHQPLEPVRNVKEGRGGLAKQAKYYLSKSAPARRHNRTLGAAPSSHQQQKPHSLERVPTLKTLDARALKAAVKKGGRGPPWRFPVMTVQQQPGAAEGDKASGAWCCSSRCSSRSWRTGPTSALLLPLHLLMVVLLCFYIVLGAAIFIQ